MHQLHALGDVPASCVQVTDKYLIDDVGFRKGRKIPVSLMMVDKTDIINLS